MRALLILISLFLVGCAKEPVTLKCTYDGSTRVSKYIDYIVIDFKQNVFIRRHGEKVTGNLLLISDDFYGWGNDLWLQPNAINRKTLEYVYFNKVGKCNVFTFKEKTLNQLITEGRNDWNKSKPPETNKI